MICGTSHKTVSRIIGAREAIGTGQAATKPVRPRNMRRFGELVAEKVAKTFGRISAKRLLLAARAAAYAGSDRNFRRLFAEAKRVAPRPGAGGCSWSGGLVAR